MSAPPTTAPWFSSRTQWKPCGENVGDAAAELFAARQGVGRVADLAADVVGLRKQGRVGDLAANAERDQGDGMGVDDGAQVGPGAVDGLVEGMFRRRPMQPLDAAVGPDANDVLRPQAALVDARRRDPDVAVLVADRTGCRPRWWSSDSDRCAPSSARFRRAGGAEDGAAGS